MWRRIESTILLDPKLKNLPALAKWLYVYLNFNNHSHLCGLYPIAEPTMEYETGISGVQLRESIDTLSDAGLIRRDQERDLIFVENMFQEQGGDKPSPKLKIAAANHLKTLRNSPLVNDFLQRYPDVEPYLADRVSAKRQASPQERERNREKREVKEENSDPPANGKGSDQQALDFKIDTSAKTTKETSPHHRLIALFKSLWEERYKIDYVFAHGKDGTHFKTILESVEGDFDLAERLVTVYFDDRETLVCKQKHQVGFLVSQINAYRAKAFGAKGASHGTDRKTAHRGAAERLTLSPSNSGG